MFETIVILLGCICVLIAIYIAMKDRQSHKRAMQFLKQDEIIWQNLERESRNER